MEIVISQRLKQHLGKCNILTLEQYGFWDGISTNNAIYKLINSVYEGWTNKYYIVCIVCDITKAFDCVCHEVLLSKLEHYRVTGIIFNWFRFYLNDRRETVYLQYTAIHHFESSVFLLLCLCILIVMYVLFCIFCFHRANWHSSATLTEVFPRFFLSCKANTRV
jgi:hypothetical protein